MISQLPDGFMEGHTSALVGELRLIEKVDGHTVVTAWRLNNEESAGVMLTWCFDATCQVEIPDDAPPGQIAALQDMLAAWGQPPPWYDAYTAIVADAQSAVGKHIEDLILPEQWALLMVLLWDRHAIADDLTIRPLDEWVTRRPIDE